MADAVAIEFLTDRRQGTGTRFACLTQVWVFRTTDIMEITEWSPPRVMGVRHAGAVSGEGRFELHPAAASGSDEPGGSTTMTWTERLYFPWWMGGSLGATLARPVLRRIWRANLTRLKTLVEATSSQ